MTETQTETLADEGTESAQLMRMIHGYRTAQIVATLARLGIAERCLPRCSVSSTASSLSASKSRSFSARNSSNSTASADAGRPGFAEANAASAASFANARKRTITLTSTPYFRAASACEIGNELMMRANPTFLLVHERLTAELGEVSHERS